MQSGTCHPYKPSASVRRTVSSTALRNEGGSDPRSTSSRNATPECSGARLDPQADRRLERVVAAAHVLDCARPRRPAARCRSVVVSRKLTSTPNSVGQSGLDDLLLNFAVEGDQQFLPDVILAQVDQRVLLGQLRERGVQRRAVGGPGRNDDGLERWRRRSDGAGRSDGAARSARRADQVADPDVGQAPDLRDLASQD